MLLYPAGRVAPLQERQLCCWDDNVTTCAVQGSFDDAQALLKALFNDRAFNAECSLGAVNSINWARVMAQIPYYFYAYFRVLDACERGAPGVDPMRPGDPGFEECEACQ